jgi:hypothetical protein
VWDLVDSQPTKDKIPVLRKNVKALVDELQIKTYMHCLYLSTGVLFACIDFEIQADKTGVCICMYWSIDTDRYALLVSRYRHLVFMLYADTQTLSCEYLCEMRTR